MGDAGLERRLAALTPPGIDDARERAAQAARVRLTSGHGGATRRPTRGRTPRRATAAAAICLALVAGGFASPQGRAVAGWVADQLGAGEPGGPPTLRELRAFGAEGTIAEGASAYVLARGPAPEGGHYEFVTWRSNRDRSHCFEVNLIDRAGGAIGTYGGNCGALAGDSGLSLDSAAGSLGAGGRGVRFVAGRAGPAVEAVRVEFDGREVDTQLTAAEEGITTRLGFARPFQVYLAFIAEFRGGGRVEVVASDGSGREVARRGLEIPDLGRRIPGP